MALYLGNQKVSLRSGQDPTFDYGFDSNGRLVFANKNAKEINNFLNYDSSYSEILDLSNLSKMEKVAVNGTADRKMEGLKGLLVSPNAPFTGSSPQINVSYTGLSKSALVSLFESVPYNVGYTKVGNPTIVDGVASGFSDSSYLLISKNGTLYGTNDFIVASSFIPSSLHNGTIFGMTSWYLNGIQVNSNGTIQGTIHASSPTSKYYTVTSSIHYVANTKYWVQLIKTNSTLKIRVSTDNINFTEDSIALDGNDVIPMTNPYQIGVGNPGVFNGSIDLNETYIKVNGVPWFTGKPAMTKTCSIVGATGTANLTQEDKNIILNKGWSLTVQ